MANDSDNDYIFGRLENEMKQIEEQKRRNAQRVKESERNWLSQILLDIGKGLGKVVTGAFEFLSDIIEKIFGSRR
jgi:hypothetical protein